MARTHKSQSQYRQRLLADGRVRCTRCQKAKPVCEFKPIPKTGKWRGLCATCFALARGEYRQTTEGKATMARYKAKPEAQAIRRAYDRTRTEKKRVISAAYRRTLRGKLTARRANLKYRMSLTTDPKRLERGHVQLELVDRELARLEARNEEVRDLIQIESKDVLPHRERIPRKPYHFHGPRVVLIANRAIVDQAIEDLRARGEIVSRRAVMEITGMAGSTVTRHMQALGVAVDFQRNTFNQGGLSVRHRKNPIASGGWS